MSKHKGLHIRKEQMRALGEYMQRQFEVRCVQRSREIGAAWYQDMEADALLAMIRRAITRAQGYRIVSEDAVIQFVTWTFRHGIDFEKAGPYAWTANILADQALSEDQKLDRMETEEIMRTKWEE